MPKLVTASCWYRNLRSAAPQETWDRIRRSTYQEYGYRCGMCGTEGRLNCQEIWEHDDETQVQKIWGLITLCDWYHEAKHNNLR